MLRQLTLKGAGWCLMFVMRQFVPLILWSITAIPVFGGTPLHSAGLIEGMLTDEHGNPVANASIRAYPADRGFTYVAGAGTDAKGAFSIGGLQWGKYAIGAKKESEDYASTYDNFTAGDTLPPVVEISRAHPKAKVTLQFRERAGVLVLSIEDTHSKVVFACVELAWASEPSKRLRTFVTDMNRRFLIPADTDVSVRVWLTDYLPWPASKGEITRGPGVVRLAPREQKTLNVTLVPDPATRNRTEDDHWVEVRRMVEVGCDTGP